MSESNLALPRFDVETLRARLRAAHPTPHDTSHLFDPDIVARLTPIVTLDSDDDPQPTRIRRKRSLTTRIRQIERAGLRIKSILPDDTIIIGEPVAVGTDDADDDDPRWH